MEVIKRTREVEEIVGYRAIDGMFFKTEQECQEYEQSARCVNKVQFNTMAVNRDISEYSLFDCGCDEYEYVVLEIKNQEELDKANKFAEMNVPHPNDDGSNRFTTEHIGKRILVYTGYQGDDNCYIEGTEEEVVEKYRKRIAEAFHPEKKVGEVNE